MRATITLGLFLGLFWGGLVVAVDQPAPIQLKHDYYDICDFKETQVCLISQSLSASELHVVMGSTLGITGTPEKPWYILIDPYAFMVLTPTRETEPKLIIKDYLGQLLDKGKTLANWSWGYTQSKSSHITYTSAVDPGLKTVYAKLGVTGATDLTAAVKVSYNPNITKTVAIGNNSPLCRAFEFTGQYITITQMTINISKCQMSFRRINQINGDDTTVIVFSGATAQGVIVSNTDIIGMSYDQGDPVYTDVTGVRFQKEDGGVQFVNNVKLSGLTFTNVGSAVVFWNAAVDHKLLIQTIDMKDIQLIDTIPNPLDKNLVLMRQADNNPPLLFLGGSVAMNVPDGLKDGSGIVTAAAMGWKLVNLSHALGPSSALYKPGSTLPVYRQNRDASNSSSTIVAMYYTVGSVSLLGIFLIIKEIVDHGRKDRREALEKQE